MFGKESAGIPEEILVDHKEDCVRIPMVGDIRSLNLGNSVAIVLYEALRQNGFAGMNLEGTSSRITLVGDYMGFEKRIDENYSYLTATDRLMVQEIRQNKELIRTMNSTQLARHLGVSRTTLVRMLKKLGISTLCGIPAFVKTKSRRDRA